MSNRDHTDVDDLFASFGAITPDADTSSKAVKRTRRALLAQADRFARLPQSCRRSQMTRRSLIATALALFVLIVALPIFYPTESPTALAQLQERLKRARTIMFETTVEMEGQPPQSMKQLLRDDGLSRTEYADGRYRIAKRTQDSITQIDIDPANKTAHVTHGFPRKEMLDLIGVIVNTPKSEGAAPIDARDVDGRSCPGFLIRQPLGKSDTQEIRVWIHPESKLPLYSEHVAELKGTKGSATGPSRAIARSRNFKYDVALEDSLFDLTPPEGYAVTTKGSPPKRRSDPWPAEKLLLTVGEGIGPVKFGMSQEQVVELLGEPEERGEPKQLVGRGGSTWEAEGWRYNSQGLWIGFSSLPEPGGLSSITCRPGNFTSQGFQGKTSEGIGLGSSPEDVRRAYGDPTEVQPFKDGLGAYRYPEKWFRVGFVDGVVYQLQIERPRKKKPAE
jgi:outer membrane lipoprotein-sorting protein